MKRAGTVFSSQPKSGSIWRIHTDAIKETLIRDHIATSLSIDPEDFECTPFGERDGLGKAHQLFGEQLPKLLACPAIAFKRRRNELNEVLAA
jgi:hypothetical protein